jgi:hypothetical protein
MKIVTRLLIAGSALMFFVALLVLFSPSPVGLIGDAQAIIGRPFTPLSYAGVARRTAYRSAVVVTGAAVATTAAVASSSAAASSAAASQAAQSAQASQAAAQQPAARASAPPPSSGAGPAAVGTVVGQLPGGCVSAPISGVEYYLCNGTYYRAAFQGNNLVYVVAKP